MITITNDPITLNFLGDDVYKQAGPARWQTNGWEIDKVIVPVRGKVTDYNDGTGVTVMNNFTPWDDWSEDNNMFLESCVVDEHKTFPTLNLMFMGKRGGILPPNRNETLSSISQTSGIMQQEIITVGGVGSITILRQQVNLTYMSESIRTIQWSRNATSINSITLPEPPTITAAEVVSLVVGGIDWADFQSIYGADLWNEVITRVLSYFFQETATYANISEVVPGQYYRYQVTQQTLLFPIITQ